jgi:hypothetical protein
MAYDVGRQLDVFAKAFDMGANVTGGIIEGVHAGQRREADADRTAMRGESLDAIAKARASITRSLTGGGGAALPVVPTAPAASAAPAGAPLPDAATPALPSGPVAALPVPRAAPAAPAAPASGALPVAGTPPAAPAQVVPPALPVGAPAPAAPVAEGNAVPTEQDAAAEEQFMAPALDLARINGIIAKGRYTDAEAKELFAEVQTYGNEVARVYVAAAMAAPGTPMAAKAVQTLLRAFDPGSNVTASLAPDGNIAVADPDVPDVVTKLTPQMIEQIGALAANNGLDMMTNLRGVQEFAVKQQNADTAQITATAALTNANTTGKREARTAANDSARIAQSEKEFALKEKQMLADDAHRERVFRVDKLIPEYPVEDIFFLVTGGSPDGPNAIQGDPRVAPIATLMAQAQANFVAKYNRPLPMAAAYDAAVRQLARTTPAPKP